MTIPITAVFYPVIVMDIQRGMYLAHAALRRVVTGHLHLSSDSDLAQLIHLAPGNYDTDLESQIASRAISLSSLADPRVNTIPDAIPTRYQFQNTL